MSKIRILTAAEQKAFDSPPFFSEEERVEFFMLDDTLHNIIAQLGTPLNRIGFLLQFGYFKATGRFFSPLYFHAADLDYCQSQLAISSKMIDLSAYKGRTLFRHQQRVANFFNYTLFTETQKTTLQVQINDHVAKCIRPKKIIFSLAQQYRAEKIILPTFTTLCELITNAYKQFEADSLSTIKDELTDKQQTTLDELMPVDKKKNQNPFQRAKLVFLKHLNQSTRPAKINETITNFAVVKILYHPLKAIIEKLGLTPQAIEYYAGWVYKARAAQVKQFPLAIKRYLHLICFVFHQYCQYQDTLIDVYLKSVQSMLGGIERKKTEAYYLSREERNKAAKVVMNDRNIARRTLREIKKTGLSTALSAARKVKDILLLVDKAEVLPDDATCIEPFEAQLQHAQDNGEHFDQLEEAALSLQRKVAKILLTVDFTTAEISEPLRDAIEYFKDKQGNILSQAPIDFLTPAQQKHLYTSKGKWRISLYKVLLFVAVADALKSGTLTVAASYCYRPLDNYLLEKKAWEAQLEKMLEQYALTGFSSVNDVMGDLKTQLNERFAKVDVHLKSGENKHIRFDKADKIIIITPKVEKPDTVKISELLKPYRYTSILHVLRDINHAAPFTDCFTHYSVKHSKAKPSVETLFGGIVAQGCNIGAAKVANTSTGIELNALNHALTWHFSLENVNAANDRIIELINDIPLPQLFRKDAALLHTGSDGQKKGVSVDTLNANHSFKYYGHGQGVSIYTFVDERCALLYSMVISSSEREAGYVIDGLLNNDVVRSDIHSTDTHGFSEIVFGLLYLLGVSFAPRIAKIKKQQLYTITPKHHLIGKDYQITPDKTINTTLIKTHWPTILRVVGSIKAKKTTASQILKRLSSYAVENPIYRAIRELGRIIKTLFILDYIDDVELRQKIQRQLNIVELSNKFSNAVFFANNQEFSQAMKEDQEIAIGCRRLMQNAIVLWNYLMLSQQLLQCKTIAEKNNVLAIIKNGSILTWGHINMQGEYDFLTYLASNEPYFDLTAIHQLAIA